MIGDLNEVSVSAFIDCFNKRLIRLHTERAPPGCVVRVAESFTKLESLWMRNAVAVGIRESIGKWSVATLRPFNLEDL